MSRFLVEMHIACYVDADTDEEAQSKAVAACEEEIETSAFNLYVTKQDDEEEQAEEINHPDIEWAKDVVRKAKGDRVSEEELDTLIWDGVMKCYLMGWCGMTLGIETDGDMHT